MSTSHISDELPRLLTGEASRDVVLAAADHLRGCPDCQQELVSAVVAHASLTSAHRFAPEVVNPANDELPDAPSSSPLPDLSGVFTQARHEADVKAEQPDRRRRVLIAVAAAAVIGAGGATAITLAGSSDSPASQSVALVGPGGAHSTATMVGTRLKIDATSLPKLGAKYEYEVWLTNATKRQSVGFIDNSRKADLTIPPNLLTQYHSIAISKQAPHQTEMGALVLQSAPGQTIGND